MHRTTGREDRALQQLETRFRHVSVRPSEALPGRLYHYTSAAGLLGIVSQGILRGTHFGLLNDSTEIKYGLGIAQDTIEALRGADRNPVRRRLLQRVHRDLEATGKRTDFYLACLCEQPDLLSQWRAYGSANGRFCIGLDTENLDPQPARVLYGQFDQHEKLSEAIDRALEAAAAGSSPQFLERVATLLVQRIIREISLFKHRGFVEEKEWRAVLPAEPAGRVKFDAASGQIKPFIELWVGYRRRKPLLPRLPIVEVWVGPGTIARQGRRSADLLLQAYGYDRAEVRESRVPWR